MIQYVPTVQEEIRRLRLNLMVHGYIYYHLNSNIITDCLYDSMSKRLVELQNKIKVIDFYDDDFKDWDGSSGYHLPQDRWIAGKALWLTRKWG